MWEGGGQRAWRAILRKERNYKIKLRCKKIKKITKRLTQTWRRLCETDENGSKAITPADEQLQMLFFIFLFFNFSLLCDHVILFIGRLWVLSIQPKRFEAGNFGKFRDILEIVKFPNRPRSIYQYSNMAPRLSGQKCKFLKFLLSLNSQKRLGYKENNTKYRSLS